MANLALTPEQAAQADRYERGCPQVPTCHQCGAQIAAELARIADAETSIRLFDTRCAPCRKEADRA